MATPADDKKAAAKKATKKTTKTASKTASKTVAKKATKAPAKTAAKKATKAPSAAKARADKPLEFDFSDEVEVASPSAKTSSAKSSAPKADGFDKAKEHAGRAFEEIATAAVVGFDHVSKKLDAAAIKAQRESKKALEKGEKWVKEHPVAASVAGSAVVGTATAALKKLFKR